MAYQPLLGKLAGGWWARPQASALPLLCDCYSVTEVENGDNTSDPVSTRGDPASFIGIPTTPSLEQAKKYKPIDVGEQCEVLSLLGDVAQGDDGKASLHLHAAVGLQDGTLRGGHLLSGSVQPTLEVTITETVVHLRRRKRPDLGIALISI